MTEDRILALARHYFEIDRPEEALATLERAAGDELEDIEYWRIRAQALICLERDSEAVTAAQNGLERDPQDVGLLLVLSVAQYELGQLDAADATLGTALDLDPDNAILHAQRALVLARKGQIEAARAALTEATRLDPHERIVLQRRAQIGVLSEDPNAPRYVDELLAEYPEDYLGHALEGNLASDQKRFGAAARSFAEAARLEPRDRELAEAARDARVAAHPILAPVQLVLRFGRWRAYFLYLGLFVVLAGARLESLRIAVVLIWLTLCAVSWLGPPILRRRERRKLGGF